MGSMFRHFSVQPRLPFRALPGILILSAFQLALAPPTQASSVRPLSEQVEEITLENGLRIFVLERDFSPTFGAYYQFNVGGAMDPKGKTGIAHLLEHMMFKGSEDVGTLDRKREKNIMERLQTLWTDLYREQDRRSDPFAQADEEKIRALEEEIASLVSEHKTIIVKNEYDEILTRAGGTSMNASTGNDVTNYFLQLPANQLELWFEQESARLLKPVFREFYSERDVVYEERRLRTENQAEGLAWEALGSLMFKAHPYGRPIVGWPEDIERYDRADAEAYFRTYYSPSNCVLAFVGDVDADEIRRLAKKHLGAWKRQEIPRLHVTDELPQRGQRREQVLFDAEPMLTMGWVTVPYGHADQYPLDLLGRILGGLASSRLDHSLVQDQRIASRVSSYHSSQRYAGTFEVTARPLRGHGLDELEEQVWTELGRIQEEGVTAAELERAKVSTRVRRVRRLESNLRLAMTIGRTVGRAGSLEYLEEQDAKVMAVTVEDVRRVAGQYLNSPQVSIVEVQRPADTSDGGPQRRGRKGQAEAQTHSRGAPPGPRGSQHSKAFNRAMEMIDSAAPVSISIPELGDDIQRVELPSGLTVYIKEDHDLPAISMDFRFLGGSNNLPVEKLAAYDLAGRLLQEGGTRALTPREVEERRDELGVSLSLWMGETECGGRLWSLNETFPEALDLTVQMLQQPRFDADRLEVLKGQVIERMRQRYDRPRSGIRILTHQVMLGDHPRLGHVSSREEVEAVTAEDIREMVGQFLGPRNMYICIVGDFDKQAMLSQLEEALGHWDQGVDHHRVWITREPARKPGVHLLEKDIPQPAVSIVQELPIDRTLSPKEHAALEILNEIFGGSGFRSRLMERLRSDEGLTYGIRSRLSHQQRPGVPGRLSISYQTKSESVRHSIHSVLEEYNKIVEQEVSSEEVLEQIQSWRNRFIFRFENEFYSVARLLDTELDDRPYDFDSQQLAEIQEVTVDDVFAAARKYLDPSNITIAIFGKLPPDDEAALADEFGLTKLSKEEVFKGGY